MKMKKFSILLATTFFYCNTSNSQSSATRTDSINESIKQKIDTTFRANKLEGILVAYKYNRNSTVVDFGFADTANKKRFSESTYFEIGSITKTFTAYALASTLQQFNIADDTPVGKWLPDSVAKNKDVASITFKELMSHTSGLERVPKNLPLFSTAPYDNYTRSDLFSYLAGAKLDGKGSFQYSNTGAALAGILAENISGKPYRLLIDDIIFRPFGMGSTLENKISNDSATGYGSNTIQPYWIMNAMAPAGGLRCNAIEMLVYLSRMATQANDEKLNTTKQLLEPVKFISPKNNAAICQGWFMVETPDKTKLFFHNGATFGFTTFAAFEPATKNVLIIVTNKMLLNGAIDKLGLSIMNQLKK